MNGQYHPNGCDKEYRVLERFAPIVTHISQHESRCHTAQNSQDPEYPKRTERCAGDHENQQECFRREFDCSAPCGLFELFGIDLFSFPLTGLLDKPDPKPDESNHEQREANGVVPADECADWKTDISKRELGISVIKIVCVDRFAAVDTQKGNKIIGVWGVVKC